MKSKISKSLFWYSLSLIILCEPVFVSFSMADLLFKIGKVIIYVYVLYELCFVKEQLKNLSNSFKALLELELFFLTITLINGVNPYYCIYYGMTFMSITFLTEKAIVRHKILAVKTIYVVFSIYLLINLLTKLFEITVIGSTGLGYYFLGLRTRVTDSVFVVLISFIVLNNFEKFKIFDILNLSLIVLSAILFNVSTLYIGLGVFFVLTLVKSNFLRKIIGSKTTLIIVTILIIGVVGFGIQRYFEVIFNLFGKSSDLTYRTYIWENAIAKINENIKSIFIGHGITELGEWAVFEGRKWQAHNQFLQIILDGGYISLLLFVRYLFYSIKNTITNIKQKDYYKIFALFIAYLCMMITEIYSYYPQLYLIFGIISNYSLIRESYIRKKRNTNDIDSRTSIQFGRIH